MKHQNTAFARGGRASSTTSSAISSPLSDTLAPTRSWASIVAPRPDGHESVDGTEQLGEGREGGDTGPSTATGSAEEDPEAEGPTHAQDDTSTESEETVRPKRKYPKRKHRKGTHTIRKEEKERLLKEMEILQKEMTALKKRAIDPTFSVDQLVRKSSRQRLQESIQGHMNTFCKALSIMSDYTLCNIQAGTPLQEKIILKKDLESRHETLQAVKARKLKEGEEFLKIRRSELDPFKALAEDQRYETDSGGFCSARFSIMQFEGVESVRQVFDLVIFYFSNMEISVSEKLETLVTVRENDDDSTTEGITQNFLMSTTTKMGMQMESNTVMFSEFCERDDITCSDRGYGIVVSEFVDFDERYPYRSTERVRKDVNGVIEVRGYNRPNHDGSGEDERVVVMTRWVQNTLHRPEFPMAVDGWQELRHSMDSWGLLLHRTLLESLHSQL
ncbi:formate dehydrogenase (NAD+) [Phytophthora pseudosyringae]|uniref:Formate dehydrogenase (NAD+) n=1 Tax=Phytophthora pseudosyringae TaxID=221518 RepID=A0A8T1VDA8_9STRA|nr:formate dehydrogenase (NAD+) [Phytophthora pseudosyringae]